MDPMKYENIKAQQEAQTGQCNQAAVGYAAGDCAQQRAVPLRMQLGKEFNSNASRQREVAQALDIITRHPEFEEFIILQRIVNRGY